MCEQVWPKRLVLNSPRGAVQKSSCLSTAALRTTFPVQRTPATSQAARSGKYFIGTPTISWTTRITFGSWRSFATPDHSTMAANRIVVAQLCRVHYSIL